MYKKIFPLVLLLIISSILNAELRFEIIWDKIFDNFNNYEVNFIQPTIDNGFVISGTVKESDGGLSDVWMIKFNHLGMPEWANYYGKDIKSGFNTGLAQTDDAGYLLSISKIDNHTGENSNILVKTDPFGTVVWEHPVFGSNMHIRSISATFDGGLIACGDVDNGLNFGKHLLVQKYDLKGDIQWQQIYKDAASGSGSWIIQTYDGGYAIAGEMQNRSETGQDFWILRLNSTGKITWERYLGGEGKDAGKKIFQTFDKGFAFWGDMNFDDTSKIDSWLIKFDQEGNVEWDKSLGGFGVDRATSIDKTREDGFVIAGFTGMQKPFHANSWIVKLDKLGRNLLDYEFLTEASSSNQKIIQTIKGDYILAGLLSADNGDKQLFVLKLTETLKGSESSDSSSAIEDELIGSGGSRFIELERERESYFKTSIENPKAEKHFDDPAVYQSVPLVRYYASYGPLFRLWSNRYEFNTVFPYLRRLQKRYEYRFVYRSKEYWERQSTQMQYILDLRQDRNLYGYGIRFSNVFGTDPFFNTSFRGPLPEDRENKWILQPPLGINIGVAVIIPMIFIWLVILVIIVIRIMIVLRQK